MGRARWVALLLVLLYMSIVPAQETEKLEHKEVRDTCADNGRGIYGIYYYWTYFQCTPQTCPTDPAYGAYGFTGGVAPFRVATGPGNGPITPYSAPSTRESAFNIPFQPDSTGAFYVYVLDANNCPLVGSCSGVFPIPTLQVTPNGICNTNTSGGSVILQASGGTPPYKFSMDNGVSYQPAMTNNSRAYTGLTAPSYEYVVMDSNSCQSPHFARLNFPTQLRLSSADISPTCTATGGSFSLLASGGTPPYKFSINQGKTFQTNATFSGLAVGNYSPILQDSQGCTTNSFQSITVPTMVLQTTPISITSASGCGVRDGAVQFNTTGGPGNYLYSLNGSVFQTSSLFSGLAAGRYSYTAKVGACTSPVQYVTIVTTPRDNLKIQSVKVASPSCDGGSGSIIGISASPGTGDLILHTNGNPYELGTPLAPGMYNLTAFDVDSCANNELVPSVITISCWPI